MMYQDVPAGFSLLAEFIMGETDHLMVTERLFFTTTAIEIDSLSCDKDIQLRRRNIESDDGKIRHESLCSLVNQRSWNPSNEC